MKYYEIGQHTNWLRIVTYESIISDVLDTIAEMRISGEYDENTLETIEWRLSAPAGDK